MREREILGELTDALAALIAEETGAAAGTRWSRGWPRTPSWGSTPRCWSWPGTGCSPGVTGPELAAELRRQGRRGLSLLQFGLAGYAKRR